MKALYQIREFLFQQSDKDIFSFADNLFSVESEDWDSYITDINEDRSTDFIIEMWLLEYYDEKGTSLEEFQKDWKSYFELV